MPTMNPRSGLNQSGFSLVNLIVGLGIGVVVMAGFVSAMQIMNRAKQTVDVKQTASEFIDAMQAAAINPLSCENNLAGNVISPKPLGNVQGADTALSFGDVGSKVSQGSMVAKGVRIKTLQIRAMNPPKVSPGAQGQIRYSMPARIQIELENTMVTPPVKLRGRYIPVQLVVDQNNAVQGCGSLDSQAQVCEELDGVWDPSAPSGLQCMPQDRCLYGGSYSDAPAQGNDANGSPNPGYINTFTGTAGCPDYFSAQSTGTVQVARLQPKYQIVYDTYTNYTCIRCLAPVTNQAGNPVTTSAMDVTGEGAVDAQGTENQVTTDGSNIQNIWSQLPY